MNKRIAWVTGAGSGIGRGLAKRLAVDGWTVAVSARSGEDLLALAGEQAGIVPFVLDVTDLDAVKAVWAQIVAGLGMPELVVLNAGTYVPVSAKDFTAEKYGANVEVNLMGTVKCLEVVMAAMRAQRSGHIAVVSSLTGYVGLPTASAYGATKAALINMCQALEPELEAEGVKLSVINPGFVDTPLTRKNEFPMPFLISTDEAVERIVKGLKSGKFEIAFPTRMSVAIRLLAALPNWARLAVTRRMLPR